MKDTPWCHGLTVTGEAEGLVGHAGAVLLRKLADQAGLTAALGSALARAGKSPLVYRAAPAAVQSGAAAADGPAAVACRCCPGGVSRSRRRPRYPSDMSEAEWAVCEPLLPRPAWLAGKGGRPSGYCC